MAKLQIHGVRAFIPAKEYATSQQFYQDLGFTISWRGDKMLLLTYDSAQFYLQDYYVKDWADNCMLFLIVEDLDAMWKQIQSSGVMSNYEDIRIKGPELYPWGFREIHVIDPAGVLWHIAQESEMRAAS